jgi:hypothetical protein
MTKEGEADGVTHRRIALALRAYEREMAARSRSKVADSHAAVALLHQPAFLEPAFHVQRKGLGGDDALKRVLALRERGVGSWNAEVKGALERLAFLPEGDCESN